MQNTSLGSEVFKTVNELREALRPVVAFRGKLGQINDLDQLRLSLLEGNLPELITRALDMHQALMMSLAFVSKADELTKVEQTVERELVESQIKEDQQQSPTPAKDSFIFDD